MLDNHPQGYPSCESVVQALLGTKEALIRLWIISEDGCLVRGQAALWTSRDPDGSTEGLGPPAILKPGHSPPKGVRLEFSSRAIPLRGALPCRTGRGLASSLPDRSSR